MIIIEILKEVWVIFSFNIKLACLIWGCYCSEGGKSFKFDQIWNKAAGEDAVEEDLAGIENIGSLG